MPEAISRRQFMSACAAFAATAAVPDICFGFFGIGKSSANEDDIRGRVFKKDAPDHLWKWSKQGFAFTRLGQKRVMCNVCPNHCILEPGDRSVCRSKVNIGGTLYTLAYGNPCAANLDPIEKKPLFHFLPATKAFSIAAAGCNFRCLNCQNWEISQARPEDLDHYDLFPDKVVLTARRLSAQSVAYTYSEAVTWFEYMIDTAAIARQNHINNLLISNGFVNTGPLVSLCDYLDAANINLKSFDDRTYRRLNGGRLDPVLNTLKTLHEKKIHLEVTTLVVPGYVDDPEQIKRMCEWILSNIGPDHPHHFLRFFPKYRLDRLPPTPVSVLTKLREIAISEGIHYVYVGNVPGHEGNHTYCHNCGRLIIRREGFTIIEYHLKKNRCIFCGQSIPGVWPDEFDSPMKGT